MPLPLIVIPLLKIGAAFTAKWAADTLADKHITDPGLKNAVKGLAGLGVLAVGTNEAVSQVRHSKDLNNGSKA